MPLHLQDGYSLPVHAPMSACAYGATTLNYACTHTRVQLSIETNMQIHTRNKSLWAASAQMHTTFFFHFLSWGRVHPQFSLPPPTAAITRTTTVALVSCLLDGMWQRTVSKSATDPHKMKSAVDIFKTTLESLKQCTEVRMGNFQYKLYWAYTIRVHMMFHLQPPSLLKKKEQQRVSWLDQVCPDTASSGGETNNVATKAPWQIPMATGLCLVLFVVLKQESVADMTPTSRPEFGAGTDSTRQWD